MEVDSCGIFVYFRMDIFHRGDFLIPAWDELGGVVDVLFVIISMAAPRRKTRWRVFFISRRLR